MIENIEVHYHRNGIGGQGFFACTFDFTEDSYDPTVERADRRQKMMAVVFMDTDKNGYSIPYPDPHVAVFDTALLPDVRFMHNSWRGNHFASDLYEAIKAWEQKR